MFEHIIVYTTWREHYNSAGSHISHKVMNKQYKIVAEKNLGKEDFQDIFINFMDEIREYQDDYETEYKIDKCIIKKL